jgi:hypothetical protein
MLTFNINCLGLPTETKSDSQVVQSLLRNYDEQRWVSSPTGGAALSAKEDGLRWSMVITASKDLGLSVLATVRGQDGKRYREMVSVGDPTMLDQFVRTECDIIAPVGSFVTPEIALAAVEDFFKEPSEPTSRVQWVDTKDLAFPEPDDRTVPTHA